MVIPHLSVEIVAFLLGIFLYATMGTPGIEKNELSGQDHKNDPYYSQYSVALNHINLTQEPYLVPAEFSNQYSWQAAPVYFKSHSVAIIRSEPCNANLSVNVCDFKVEVQSGLCRAVVFVPNKCELVDIGGERFNRGTAIELK